jgi:OPA family glycerol-3-phosphate transporter-like MFS transporter
VGLLPTLFAIPYALGQIVNGTLADHFRPRNFIAIGLLGSAAVNMLFSFAPSYPLLMVLWCLNGCFQSMIWTPIVAIMAESFDENQYAKGTLIISIGSHAATILIYILVPFFLLWFDWRSSFLFAAAWAVMFAVLWLIGYPAIKRRLPSREKDSAQKTEASQAPVEKTGFLRLLVSSGVVVIVVAIAMQGFLKDGIQAWMPTFFTEVFQMSSSAAILSNMVLPVFNIIVVWVATALYQKVFRHETREAIVLFGVAAVLCIALALLFESSAILCLILAALITGCMHGINLMLICFVPRRFRKQGKVATVTGVCNACSYLGSTVSSYGIAAIAEAMGWQKTLFSWALVALVGLGPCVVITSRWNRFIRENE